MEAAGGGGDVAAVLGWVAARRRSERIRDAGASVLTTASSCGVPSIASKLQPYDKIVPLTAAFLESHEHQAYSRPPLPFVQSRYVESKHTMQESPQPSTANIAVACAILAGVTGYFLGTAKSLGLFGGSPISAPPPRKSGKAQESEDESTDDGDDDDDEEVTATAPAEFPGHTEECKMVLVVRTDLGMTKGMCTSTTRAAAQRT